MEVWCTDKLDGKVEKLIQDRHRILQRQAMPPHTATKDIRDLDREQVWSDNAGPDRSRISEQRQFLQ